MSRRRKPVRRHPATMRKLEQRAASRALAGALPPPRPDRDTLAHYVAVAENVRRYCEAYGFAEGLAWGTMTYACAGRAPGSEGCGWEHKVWLLFGVEGPEPLRDERAFVPAPFMCGGCPICGGALQHVRWNEDEDFGPPGRELPPDVAYFRVPTHAEAEVLAGKGYGGAQYVDPAGRTR